MTNTPRSTLQDNIVRMAVENPHVLRAGADLFAQIQFEDADLDHIRHAVLDLWADAKTVDHETLSHHLQRAGLESASRRVLRWPVPMARKPGVGRSGETLSGDVKASSGQASSGQASPVQAGDVQRDPSSGPQGPAPLGVERRAAEAARLEKRRQEAEAEWLAFVALDVAGPQVREEIDEARQHDLDNDDNAFKAAMSAMKAKRTMYGNALARGRDDTTDADAGVASPAPDPEDRAV